MGKTTIHPIGRGIEALSKSLAWYSRRTRDFKTQADASDIRKDVQYCEENGLRMDVYRPLDAAGPLPYCVYLHGGGFQILDKSTHAVFGLRFAMMGYACFILDYRLAPKHRFPAAVQDVVRGCEYIQTHATDLGVDPAHWFLAGESAGANLALGAALSTCVQSPPTLTAGLAQLPPPLACLPACGLLEVSRPERFKDKTPGWIYRRIREVEGHYAPENKDGIDLRLMNPLTWLESQPALRRPLPDCFIAVGTADPIASDSMRAAEAIRLMAAHVHLSAYPKHGHAFHAFMGNPAARHCWRETEKFLARAIPTEASRDKSNRTLP